MALPGADLNKVSERIKSDWARIQCVFIMGAFFTNFNKTFCLIIIVNS